ncbi:MAG: GntR family transcriptional regulator [Proteobacteria bacterium]|nr:GntR family transcriptional regulator [Pseudomonadota bacterium]
MPRSQTRHSLANQILDIVRNARLEAGHHLREQWLGDLLGVSRTPIRAALDLLAERGAVETRKNQGFFLVQSFDALQRLQVEVPSSAEQSLYKQLVRDRLAGKLPGSVTQSEIAKRYDVDRGVLMRALSRLAEDNLVARNKGHGWRFLPTLATDVALRNSYEFRLAIEPAGILLDSFRPNPAVIERCRLQHMVLLSNPDLGSVDSAQLFETDVAFHEALAEFSGNLFLLQAVQQQNRLRRLFEFWSYGNKRRVRDWCREHLAIIDALEAQDFTRAANAMREHLTNAYEERPQISANAKSGKGSANRKKTLRA